ncbi:MAG: hypothetical protein QXF23_07225 [Candidatus Bathyarchaeia archaeon]
MWKIRITLAFIAIFLSVLLLNSISMQSNTLTVRFFPTVIKEDEPVVITITLNNIYLQPQKFHLRLYVNSEQVAAISAQLEPRGTQLITYTCPPPKIGQALRIYVEAINLDNGEMHGEYLNIPQAPPELLMGFSAFSSFASSLTSTTSTTSMATITYYLNTMGLTTQEATVQPAINTGVILSITLILLLIFIELTDPAYGKMGRRISALRGRYAALSTTLLLIFSGIVLTKIVMIIAT